MSEESRALDAVAGAIVPLLAALDALAFIARHLHPPALPRLLERTGGADVPLRTALAALRDAPRPVQVGELVAHLRDASEQALRAFDLLRECPATENPTAQAYRALRHVPRALEALYPLASVLRAVSRFFLAPDARGDETLLSGLADPPAGPSKTGIMHAGNEREMRGGFSMYVPETYDPSREHPLVMTLHGGSGHGRAFFWTWLAEARSRGAILVSPTATGSTWSLMEPEIDSANLAAILDRVRQEWNVDPERLLLTGMSDGGTFTLLSGLHEDSPFTHLAPVAASFHPMLVAMAEPKRISGLPVYLVHGALDWMFSVSMGRAASKALAQAGARVTYREITDLSHTYPREENVRILDWMMG